jgi:hypothetical protein
MLVRLNDVVRLKVEQGNGDKNPLSICQGRDIDDKKKKLSVFSCILNIVTYINIDTRMVRTNDGRKIIMRHE